MPWYSTTDQQHPAFHLQIVNNPLKAGFIPNGSSNNIDAANNNHRDDGDDDEGGGAGNKIANGHAQNGIIASPRRGVCVSVVTVNCVNDVTVNRVNGVSCVTAAGSPRKKKSTRRKESSCTVNQVN